MENSLTAHSPVSVQEEQKTHNISYESGTGRYPRQIERNTILLISKKVSVSKEHKHLLFGVLMFQNIFTEKNAPLVMCCCEI